MLVVNGPVPFAMVSVALCEGCKFTGPPVTDNGAALGVALGDALGNGLADDDGVGEGGGVVRTGGGGGGVTCKASANSNGEKGTAWCYA